MSVDGEKGQAWSPGTFNIKEKKGEEPAKKSKEQQAMT